jgi:von Willebrand factor type A domain/Aerotolerance regulator N-terminal
MAALVMAPYLAHRLRRKNAQEQIFPPARLVLPAPPRARRRSRLEDRALLATRAAAVVALAVLGATPFVRCSQLSLHRAAGASIAMAIIVDDSMSMRAASGAFTRFERARRGAVELVSSAREGDSVAVILAGAPVRVELASTTDLGAARRATSALTPSDRGTDLEGAVARARELLASAVQTDRRIVLLSDLADGHAGAEALSGGADEPMWTALPELAAGGGDCALVRADQRGARVHVELECGPGQSASGREIVVEDAKGGSLGRAPAPAGEKGETSVFVQAGDAKADHARLTGADAIADDDRAPVLPEVARGTLAVVADSTEEAVATGGAPIVEQALGALKLDVDVAPLPAVPDTAEELSGRLGVVLDDPSGLTPEQRHVLAGFIEGGGVVLLALGPRAAAAPLGATFEPILTQAVTWDDTTQRGVDARTVIGGLAESAESLSDLGATRRALLSPADAAMFKPLANWNDGAPLIARRDMGRGEIWIVALPFSLEASDLTLRPAFLALLREWLNVALAHAAPVRAQVGASWSFPGGRSVRVEGPSGLLDVAREGGVARVCPPWLGVYRITVDGHTELRVAQVDAREVDLRPRAVAAGSAGADAAGQRRELVDVSGYVALVLLVLLSLEMALRLSSRSTAARAV